jgi:cell division protein FtsL
MLTLKRKTNEKDELVGYETERINEIGSTIEIGDQVEKSYNSSLLQDVKSFNFTTVDTPVKTKSATMHTIKKQKKAESSSEKIETIGIKEKASLIAFIAAALVLAAIVIMTGVAITESTNRVRDLELRIAASQELLAMQAQELLDWSNPDEIMEKAAESGKVLVTNPSEVSLFPPAQTPNVENNSNAFDDFLDFISSWF